MKNATFFLLLVSVLSIAFLIPAISISEESPGYISAHSEHYSYSRLASLADTIVLVEVTDVYALKDSSGMIVSGEDSCISMKAKVLQVIKGNAPDEIIIFSKGHQLHASGRMLKGKAIYFLNRKKCDVPGAIPSKWNPELMTFSTVDRYGKILLKGMDDEEVASYVEEVRQALK